MTTVAGRILGHNDLELPVPGGKLKESLHGSRLPDRHDDLVGVDMLDGLLAEDKSHCFLIS